MSGRQTILFVEDNVPLQGLVQIWLEDAGYRVVLASTGDEGFSVARRRRPDLVVTDAMMPGMSGDSMVESLKADPVLADIPIVMATAALSAQRVEHMLELGCSSVIGKPLTEQQLLDAVAVALREADEATEVGPVAEDGRIAQLEAEVAELRARR